MEANKKPTRGGARPGAGRKPINEDRRNMTLRVSLHTLKMAGALRDAGEKVNTLVEAAISERFHELHLRLW